MSTSVGMILIALATLSEARAEALEGAGVAIFREALVSTAQTIANIGAYDTNASIPWQVTIFIIVIVLTTTFMLGCACGRLTGTVWQDPRARPPVTQTPNYDSSVIDHTRFYKTRLGERLHFRRHCSTLVHSRNDEMMTWRVCLVCSREHEK
jgi:hypothetical protein